VRKEVKHEKAETAPRGRAEAVAGLGVEDDVSQEGQGFVNFVQKRKNPWITRMSICFGGM